MSVENTKRPENHFIKVLSYTLDSVQKLADANSVLGEKIEINGTTIIPVSKISVGFAGGGADLIDAGKKKRQSPVGTGGNVTVTPLTFLVINEEGVKTVNIQAEKKPSTAAEVVNAIMEQIKNMKEEQRKELPTDNS